MSKISVIIPTHNRAHYIVETIESVTKQSFSEFEIIIVDDGSTDDTRAVIGEYADLPNFHYYYQENQGRSAARNFGMEKASGEYLMFLDSDDHLLPGALETLYSVARQYPESGVVGGRGKFIDDRGQPLYAKEYFGLQNEVFAENLRVEKIRRFFLCQGSYIIKKTLAQKLNGFKTDLHAGEDLDFFLRYCDVAKVSVVKTIVVYVRKHASNTPDALVDEAVLRIARENLQLLEENPQNYNSALLKKMKIEWQYKMADDYYVANDNSNAFRQYLKALRIAPELLFDRTYLKLVLMTFVPSKIRNNVKSLFSKS